VRDGSETAEEGTLNRFLAFIAAAAVRAAAWPAAAAALRELLEPRLAGENLIA
jgi:anti-sigma factor RsiW